MLAAIKKDFPESLAQVTIQLAKGFTIKKQPERALNLLNKVKATSKNNALWHHQMSLALQASNKNILAQKHQKQAMSLAKQQNLPSWLVWELTE